MDELASRLGIDPITFCATNIIGPGEPMIAWGDPSDDEEHDDLRIASYGLDQCLDVVRDAAHTDGPAAPDGWLVGHGTAIAMIATGPPGGHIADARLTLTEDGRYDIAVGTAEFGNGTTTVHAQIAAGTLGTTADRVTVRQSDTDLVRHDTGTFASTGVVVAGKAVLRAAQALRKDLLAFAAEHTRTRPELCDLAEDTVDCAGRSLPLKELREAMLAAGQEPAADGHFGGSPRSVAFNAQWFRMAVNPGTGEIKILPSVHAADAGKVMNPMQCRGQVEGGVAQALGAILYEHVRVDDTGQVTTRDFRRYHVPTYADLPRIEVRFVTTDDAIGPLGAKSMSESPFNPVAPALANALRDATGIRFTRLPLTHDVVWLALQDTEHRDTAH